MKALAVLACLVGSSAVELDFNYLSSVSDDLHNYVTSHLRSLLKEHAKPHQVLPIDLRTQNQTACKACTQEGAKYILGQTAGKMKDICSTLNTSDSRSCMASKVCTMMGKHPKVMLGMMIEHVRPMSLGTAYCVGKGACAKPDEITMTEIALGSEPHEALLDNFDQVDWSEVESSAEELIPEGEETAEDEISPCEEQNKKMPVCPKCMKRAMRHVMGRAIMKVKGMCANSACQTMKKMCPWMRQNKEVSLGMLIGKVEPWKMAFGFCLHKERSHHGHPHHGHHRPHAGGSHGHPHHGHHGPHAGGSWGEFQDVIV